MKAVIPAAGLGIRFLPHTKAQPKEMIPIVDKPAIQYVVEEALASDMRDILIVTGRGKRAIEDHFDANAELEDHLARIGRSKALDELRQLMQQTRIMYVRQAVPRGLGDAVLCGEPFVNDEPFAVLLGDDITMDPPCAQVLATAFRRFGGSVLALQEVSPDEIGRYGMVAGKQIEPGILRVEETVEKPTPEEVRSNLATIGRYILTPGIFPSLRRTAVGRGGELQLTDGVRDLLKSEDVYGVLYQGRRYDVGDKVGWLCANLEIALRRGDLREDLTARILGIAKGLSDFR
ncbi:MAG: UTP--glucose-1-phosphate uridylyltransferase GalU [Thermoplasmata archaeon]